MFERVLRVAALCAALGGTAMAAHAQTDAETTGAEDDPVVARIEGEEIKRSDVLSLIGQLPPQVQQMPVQMIFPALLEQVINGKLVAKAGYEADLQDEEEVRERLARAEERIVQEVYLTREVESRITDEGLRQKYQEFLEENPPEEQVRARHILVESEEEAKEVIAEVKGGADFAEVANSRSTGPSSSQGGDLGYFSKGDMVEPFAEAAFALQPGQITEEPVQTQFGWHVIKVEDRRTPEPPAFEAVADQLRSELSQDIIGEIVDDLRADAEVERFQFDGSPLPPEDAEAAPAQQ